MPAPGRPPGWQSSRRLWELWSEVLRRQVYRDWTPPAPFAGPGSPPPTGVGAPGSCAHRGTCSHLEMPRAPWLVHLGHFTGSQMCQQTVPGILKAYSVTLTQFLPNSGVATTISLDWMLSLETHQANWGIDLGGLGKLRSRKGGNLPRDVYSFNRS